VSVATLGFY